MCRLLQCIAMCMPHLTQVVLCCADLIQHRCKDAENFWTKLFWCTHHLTIHSHITQVSLGTHLTHRRESPHTGVRMERPHTGVRRHSQIRGCAIQTHNNALTLLLYFYSNWTMIYKSFFGPRRRNLLMMSDRWKYQDTLPINMRLKKDLECKVIGTSGRRSGGRLASTFGHHD